MLKEENILIIDDCLDYKINFVKNKRIYETNFSSEKVPFSAYNHFFWTGFHYINLNLYKNYRKEYFIESNFNRMHISIDGSYSCYFKINFNKLNKFISELDFNDKIDILKFLGTSGYGRERLLKILDIADEEKLILKLEGINI